VVVIGVEDVVGVATVDVVISGAGGLMSLVIVTAAGGSFLATVPDGLGAAAEAAFIAAIRSAIVMDESLLSVSASSFICVALSPTDPVVGTDNGSIFVLAAGGGDELVVEGVEVVVVVVVVVEELAVLLAFMRAMRSAMVKDCLLAGGGLLEPEVEEQSLL
jgi:hypothetical protein